MKKLFFYVSWCSLIVIIIALVLHLRNAVGQPALVRLIGVCTVVWFISAPLWMKRDGR